MRTVLENISLISSIVGFLLLNLVCFYRLCESMIPSIFRFSSIHRRVMSGTLSIVVPIIISFAVIEIGTDIGVSFTSFHRGTVVGNGVFPAITFVAIVAIQIFMAMGAFCLRKILRTKGELIKLTGWRGPIFGALIAGWVIPMVVVIGKLYVFDRHHIYWTEAQRHSPGVNLCFFMDAISFQCVCVVAIIHVCVYVGVFIFMCFPKVAVPDKPGRYVRRFSLGDFSVFVIIIGIIAAFLYSTIHHHSATPYRMREAMIPSFHYQHTHKTLPLYSKSDDGTPLHSWRVLILPYLYFEENKKEFYENIRLDEPWDSEFNRQFHFAVPEIFQSREKNRKRTPEERRTLCDFSAVVGPNAFFQGETARLLEDVANKQETIFLVERQTPVHWMDPNHELNEESLREYKKTKITNKTGRWILFLDGHVEKWDKRKITLSSNHAEK